MSTVKSVCAAVAVGVSEPVVCRLESPDLAGSLYTVLKNSTNISLGLVNIAILIHHIFHRSY